jgi:hypothetical protein
MTDSAQNILRTNERSSAESSRTGVSTAEVVSGGGFRFPWKWTFILHFVQNRMSEEFSAPQ